MSTIPADRTLLQRCLKRERGAWNDFVDRFLGLIYHVVQHTAHARSAPLHAQDIEDVAAEVLLQIVANDYHALRQFQGRSNLSTYLTVIARRTCIHELTKRLKAMNVRAVGDGHALPDRASLRHTGDEYDSIEEVQNLLTKLSKRDRKVMRMYHLEGRTYEEISTLLDIPVNTIGPLLSRARKALSRRMLQQIKKQPRENHRSHGRLPSHSHQTSRAGNGRPA